MKKYNSIIKLASWLIASIALIALWQFYFLFSLDTYNFQRETFYYCTIIVFLVFLIKLKKKSLFFNQFLLLLICFAPIKLLHDHIYEGQVEKSILIADNIVKDINVFFNSKKRYPSKLLELYPNGEPKYYIGLRQIKFNYFSNKSEYQIEIFYLNGTKYIYFSSIKKWVVAD